jgi:hypothetical protein
MKPWDTGYPGGIAHAFAINCFSFKDSLGGHKHQHQSSKLLSTWIRRKVHQQEPIYLLQQTASTANITWTDPSCFVCLHHHNLWDEGFDEQAFSKL